MNLVICGNCDFLITSDHHFDVLKEVEFPKVEVIAPKDFIEKYL
jgi:predicted nucleic acid-binding protein